MKIINGLDNKIEIGNLDKWFELCPPKKGIEQWKDLHSAKEMAKFWLEQKNQDDFQIFIKKAIPEFAYDYAIPEYVSTFDNYDSPRKHDLYIVEKNNKAVITIEGKANEFFGNDVFGNEFINAIKTKIEKQNSHKIDRMINLYNNYFHSDGYILTLMYQLVYWFAGSLVDAIKEDTDNFIMVLQEFRSEKTDFEKINKNHNDFENFIDFISEGKHRHIENKQIIGPITNKFTNDKQLFIGYYSIDL